MMALRSKAAYRAEFKAFGGEGRKTEKSATKNRATIDA
jgi:hypothetical protein